MARMILIPTTQTCIDADQVRRVDADNPGYTGCEISTRIFFNDGKHLEILVPSTEDAKKLRDEIAKLVDRRGPSFIKTPNGNIIDPRLIRYARVADEDRIGSQTFPPRIIIGFSTGNSGFGSGENINHEIVNCETPQEAKKKRDAFMEEVEQALAENRK